MRGPGRGAALSHWREFSSTGQDGLLGSLRDLLMGSSVAWTG